MKSEFGRKRRWKGESVRRFLIAGVGAALLFLPSQHFGSVKDGQQNGKPCKQNAGGPCAPLKEPCAPKDKMDSFPPEPTNECPPKRSGRISQLEIGGNYTWVKITPEGSPDFTGSLGGAQLLYEYQPMWSFYAGIKGMWRQGNTTATGASRYIIDVDAHERFGYTIGNPNGRGGWATLFTGFGFRYIAHKLTQNGNVLQSNYNEFYVPVGALLGMKFGSFFSIGLNGIWMPQVDTTVKLIPIDNVQWEIERQIGNYLIEVPFSFYFGAMKQYLLVVKPFYEHWQDGASTAVTLTGVPLGLPENTYNFWGGEVNFGFKF